jgi:hypothetical protein
MILARPSERSELGYGWSSDTPKRLAKDERSE